MTHEIEEGVMATAAMKAQAKCIDDGVQFASISFDLGFTAGYQAALPQWQDISTAPIGDDFIAVSGKDVGVVYISPDVNYEFVEVEGGLFKRVETSRNRMWGEVINPTHWMPLPLPPEEGEG